MNNAEKVTGLTRNEVLAGIKNGKIHPNSRIVAQHELAAQDIFNALPRPHFMVGCLAAIPQDVWTEIWPDEPFPQDS